MKSALNILCLISCWGILSGLQPVQRNATGKTDQRISREILQKFKVREFNLKKLAITPGGGEGNESRGAFFGILTGDSLIGYLYTGRVNSCRKGGCSGPDNGDRPGEHEFFDYFTLFGQNKTVVQVVVHNYEATHGQEITAKGWLRQFTGYDGGRPLKPGKDIDAISGATISVQGIVEDISEQCAALRKFR